MDLMLTMTIGGVAMLAGFLGFVLCLGLKLAAVGLYSRAGFGVYPVERPSAGAGVKI